VRVCDEHRCILLRNSDIWKRYNTGQLRLRRPYTVPKISPTQDHRKRSAPWAQQIALVDDTYQSDHLRHIVLDAHCTRYDDGTVGASGLIDPKEILIENTLYIRVKPKDAHCALCEGGDMIPFEMRHVNSLYKPATPKLSMPRLLWMKLRKKYYRRFDRWAQRECVKRTMPPSGLS
jgi:hypothetical protein